MPNQQHWTLVTGASGFVGSRLVRHLVDSGRKVRAFVRPGSDLSALRGLSTDRFRLVYGDVAIEHTVYRALVDCDAIYHLAAEQDYSRRSERQVTRAAVEGVRGVLGAARRRPVEKIVVTSCATTLGVERTAQSMDEEHAFNLDGAPPYVEAKRESEAVALEALDAGLPVVVVLPAITMGPGDRRPTPAGKAIVSYLTRSPLFRVPVTNGGVSIVDVDDVVAGHVRAMERGTVGERYALGGENLTYEQIVETLSELTGLAPATTKPASSLAFSANLALLGSPWTLHKPLFEPGLVRAYADAFVWVASDKAQSELGYEYRSGRQTLMRAVRWFLETGFVADRAARRVRLELSPG